MFLEDISEFPPHREVDASIELVPREARAWKASYRMGTPELVELKLWLKEILDKGYSSPSLSPWGTSIFFMKKKDDTLRLWIDYMIEDLLLIYALELDEKKLY